MNPIKRLYKFLCNWRWEVGFLQNDIDSVLRGDALDVRWVRLPFKDRWFADPFILEITDNDIVLLCEEYSDELKRGRLARLVIDRLTYELKSWNIILDLPSHLSFPEIVRLDGRILVCPENSESGKSTIYEYDPQAQKLTALYTISDEPLTDAVYTEKFDGRRLLFSTSIPNQNKNTTDISEWDEEKRRFVKTDEIVALENTGRMAGDFFESNGKIYRPVQESNTEYGHAVEIQEVSYEDGQWKARPVRRIVSPHPVLKSGFHTFNSYGDLTVVDAKGYRYPVIGQTLKGIAAFVKEKTHTVR